LRFNSIRLVVDLHPSSELPLTLESVTSQLATAVDGKRNLSGVPSEAPPEIPRLIVSSKQLQVQIGLSRVESVLFVPDHVATTSSSAFAYMRQMITGPLAPLYVKLYPYKWAGVVLELDQAVVGAKSMVDAIRASVSKLTNINHRIEDLAAFNLQYGFKEGDYFKHIKVQGYETRIVKKRIQAGQPLRIQQSEGTLMEAGIQLLVDVNNKPKQIRYSTLEDINSLVDEVESFSKEAPSIAKLNDIFPTQP
jgi:hypothetical protein